MTPPVGPKHPPKSIPPYPSWQPSIIPAAEPAFTDPIIFSTFLKWLGLHLPVRANNPLLTQLAMDQSDGILVDPRGIPFTQSATDQSDGNPIDPRRRLRFREFSMALIYRDKNPEEAGRIFTKLRDELRGASRGSGEDYRLYVEATLGSAEYGKVTPQTFDDLRIVRKRAEKKGDTFTMAREMLARSIAHFRINDDESAMVVLDNLMDTPEFKQNIVLRIFTLIHHLNLQISNAKRHKGVERSFALNTVADIMKSSLREAVEELQIRDGDTSELMGTLAKTYIYVAEFLLARQQARPLDALEVINEARVLFPENRIIQGLFARGASAEDGIRSSEVSPLQQLIMEKHGVWDQFVAGATEFLRAARYPSNGAYWRQAALGSLAGGAVVAGAAILAGAEPSLSDVMMGSAVGATGTVAVGHLRAGLRAPETVQAFKTGYTNGSLTREALKEVGRLLGTYLVFGGIVPGATMLPDFLQMTDQGQIFGPGGLFAYLERQGAIRTEELVGNISSLGLTDGLAAFWDHWVHTSYFAEALNNGFTLPFDDIFGRLFAKSKWDTIPEFMRTFSFDTPEDAARTIGLLTFYGYSGISTLYALATLNPYANDFLDEKMPGYTKWLAWPGTFFGTYAAMVASGLPFWPDPLITILFGYAIEHRHWVQGAAGKWKIGLKDIPDLPLMTYATAAAVQLLYIAPGNAIRPHLPSLAQAGSAGQFLWNSVLAHVGMVGFLIPLGVLHAQLTGTNVVQTLKAKLAKAWTYENASNPVKLMLGWDTWQANVFGPAIKEFGPGAIITNSYREAGNGPIQRYRFGQQIVAHEAFMRRILQASNMPATPVQDLDTGPIQVETGLNREMLGLHPAAGEAEGIEADSGPNRETREGRAAQMQAEMIKAANEMHDDGVKAALRGQAYGYLNNALFKHPIADQLLTLQSVYYMQDDRRVLLTPDFDAKWYTSIIYRALTDPYRTREVINPENPDEKRVIVQGTSSETVAKYLERLMVIASDVSPELRHVRYNMIVATMRAMAGTAHGEQIEEFFTTGPGKSLIEAYGLQGVLDEMLGRSETVKKDPDTGKEKVEKAIKRIPRDEGRYAWISVPVAWHSRAAKWIEKHITTAVPTAEKFYAAAAVAGRRYDLAAPVTGRSAVQNLSFLSSLLLAASQKNVAFQTRADATLFAGTLYGFLMKQVDPEKMTTEAYQTEMLLPLLDLIKHCAEKLGDNRKDVRHNLLVTAWLASQGPHGEPIRRWMEENRGIFQANGIYAMLKVGGADDRLPQGLDEKKLIKRLFSQYLWDSTSSTDGLEVYPVKHGFEARHQAPLTVSMDRSGIAYTAVQPGQTFGFIDISDIKTDVEKQLLIDMTGKWLADSILNDGVFYEKFSSENVKWIPGENGGLGRPNMIEFNRFSRLTPEQRQKLTVFLAAVMRKGVGAVADALNAMTNAALSSGGGQLLSEISEILGGDARLSDKVQSLFALALMDSVTIETNYVKFLESVMSWEEMMQKIDPDVDFGKYAAQVLDELAKSGGTPGSPLTPAAAGGEGQQDLFSPGGGVGQAAPVSGDDMSSFDTTHMSMLPSYWDATSTSDDIPFSRDTTGSYEEITAADEYDGELYAANGGFEEITALEDEQIYGAEDTGEDIYTDDTGSEIDAADMALISGDAVFQPEMPVFAP